MKFQSLFRSNPPGWSKNNHDKNMARTVSTVYQTGIKSRYRTDDISCREKKQKKQDEEKNIGGLRIGVRPDRNTRNDNNRIRWKNHQCEFFATNYGLHNLLNTVTEFLTQPWRFLLVETIPEQQRRKLFEQDNDCNPKNISPAELWLSTFTSSVIYKNLWYSILNGTEKNEKIDDKPDKTRHMRRNTRRRHQSKSRKTAPKHYPKDTEPERKNKPENKTKPFLHYTKLGRGTQVVGKTRKVEQLRENGPLLESLQYQKQKRLTAEKNQEKERKTNRSRIK